MTYEVSDYHRSIVVAYYLTLLIRFGPTALLKHLPKIKNLVWTEAGLAMLKNHKAKQERKEVWSA
jgi:hypothetical protein